MGFLQLQNEAMTHCDNYKYSTGDFFDLFQCPELYIGYVAGNTRCKCFLMKPVAFLGKRAPAMSYYGAQSARSKNTKTRAGYKTLCNRTHKSYLNTSYCSSI